MVGRGKWVGTPKGCLGLAVKVTQQGHFSMTSNPVFSSLPKCKPGLQSGTVLLLVSVLGLGLGQSYSA